VRVDDITDRASVVRDLALIKVSANHQNRAAVLQLAHVFHARVVDVAPESLVVEMVGSEAKIDGLLEVLRPYGIIEMVRTGRVAMARGSAAAPRYDVNPLATEAEEGFSYSV
jgi:acetolactate synthase I/III small subunit